MLIRILLTLLVSLALLATAAPPAAAQLATSPWPMFQHDPLHTGKSTAVGPSSGAGVKTKWTPYKAVSWIKTQVAIGPDSTIYFGDSKFPLCALNPNTGLKIWCADDGGFVNASSPAVGNPVGGVQTVYIGERNNIFWAFDGSNGDDLWHFQIFLDGDIRSSPLIHTDATIYMACGCTTAGRLHAFNNTAGPNPSLKWMVQTINIRNSSPAARVVNFGGTSRLRLYVGTTDGSLVAIDDFGQNDGRLAWTSPLKLATKDYHSSPSIGPDGTIYVGTNKGLFAVEDKGNFGQVRAGWPFTDNAPGEWDTAAAISNGILYASRYYSGTRTLYAIDIDPPTAAPTKLWSKGPLAGSSSVSNSQTPSPVIDANGTVYAAFGKLVYALNPTTGAEIWPEPFRLGGDAISLAVGDGVLYVTAKDYKLYALVNK
jgi:outer membrane protein assembly factor BamB